MLFRSNAKLRSKGYGSRILEEIKKTAGKKEILINVEKPDECAENNMQRVRRIAFYERNGFYRSGFDLRIGGTDYLVFSTSEIPDRKEFSNIIKKYHFGQIQMTDIS